MKIGYFEFNSFQIYALRSGFLQIVIDVVMYIVSQFSSLMFC